MTNEKLNITSRDLWSVLIAAAATALCAAIDVIPRDAEDEENGKIHITQGGRKS